MSTSIMFPLLNLSSNTEDYSILDFPYQLKIIGAPNHCRKYDMQLRHTLVTSIPQGSSSGQTEVRHLSALRLSIDGFEAKRNNH